MCGFRGWVALAVCGLVGCGETPTPSPGPHPPAVGQGTTNGATKANGNGTTNGGEVTPPPRPEIPKVLLTEDEAGRCLVKVGDAFPEAKLPMPTGEEASLSQLRQNRPTVILFWTAETRAGKAALKSLALQASPDPEDVRYVTVCVGGTPAEVKATRDESGATLPTLHDQDASLLKKVAVVSAEGPVSEALPRVYFVDAGGKVLWFSPPPFSVEARGELQKAIEFLRFK